MAEPETDCRWSSHVVVDIEAQEEEEAIVVCVVCMEPMEWVAAYPCGHREVCVRCAATIRFSRKDLRCCICRSRCPTVLVTNANHRSAGGGQRGGFSCFLWLPPPPPAFASEVVVMGHYYWYHRGMGAYFDDVNQYQEMEKVYGGATSLASSEEGSILRAAAVASATGLDAAAFFQQPAASVNVNCLNVSVPPRQAADVTDPPLEPQTPDVGTSLICVSVGLWLLAIVGLLMIDRHPYPKVLIVAPLSALFPAFTACTIYALRKFSNNSLRWGWMH